MSEPKEKKNTSQGPRSEERFKREAKALQKNLEKRRKQQAEREKQKETKED